MHEQLAILVEYLVHHRCTEVTCRQHSTCVRFCRPTTRDTQTLLYHASVLVRLSQLIRDIAKMLKNATYFCLQWTPLRGYRAPATNIFR